MEVKLQIEYLPVEALEEYSKNTRKHEKDDVNKIKQSIAKYGFNDPIGIWSDHNVIVEGHGRLAAAKSLGLTEVPVIRLDHMTDEERRQYAIAHNRTAEFSEWDLETLAEELEALDFGDLDLGFDLDIDVGEEKEAVEDDFDEEPPEVPVVQKGDVYRLGRHRLMCGDSTSADDVKTLAGGNLVDMLLTDPPYGVSYVGGTGMSIENDSLKDEEFLKFLTDAFSAANEVMKPGAVFYIWHADSKGHVFRNACKNMGWQVRECLIWVKNSLVLGRMDYQYRHEPCLYGWKEGSHLWASDRKQTTILEFDKPRKNDVHPTMKPVPLFDYQMKNNTKGGDIVLDLFSGSGTTMVAAEQNGRTAYCMEFDPKYAQVIIERYIALTGDKDGVVRIDENGETPWSEIAQNK